MDRPGNGITIVTGLAIQAWDRVRTSLWFVPGLMAMGALVLAAMTPLVNGLVPVEWTKSTPLFFSGSAVGARAVLGTIATATIGVAGVVFSMTIVSLQLASSQFGPRLLRSFLRDRGNQLVLGTFLATFLYCIVVLPMVNGTGDSVFIPHTAVTIAVLLAIASLAVLVYFIDHIAQSIHADAVLQSVSEELESVIDKLFPSEVGDRGGQPNSTLAESHDALSLTVRTDRSGYIRFINGDQLLSVAHERDLFVYVRRRPGEFVMRGDCVATVSPAARVDDAACANIESAFSLGAHRTALQDVLFTFEQVSEVAIRALSPGINDPTTAVHCIDRIGAGLVRVVTREKPSPWRTDDTRAVRVRMDPVELPEILASTVESVSRSASVHFRVWLRLVEVLLVAATRAKRRDDADALRACAMDMVVRGSQALESETDRERLAAAARDRAAGD